MSICKPFAAAVLLFAFTGVAPAAADPVPAPKSEAAALMASPLIPFTLVSLIEDYSAIAPMHSGMKVAPAPMQEVMVARIAIDGSIVTACVATEEEARKFLLRTPESPSQTPAEK